MERGKGIQVKVKYRWCKQPNGRYTIFDVPVFSAFKRDDEDEKGNKIVRSAGPKELKKILSNFFERKEKGYYPPIHVGHQDLMGVSNAPGAGYMDNLQKKNNDILADLTELNQETLERFHKKNFLGCSCEYKPGKIEGLALLETKPPFFKFPLIALEEKPSEMSEESIQMFSDRTKIIQFSEGEKLEEEKKEYEGEESQAAPEEEAGEDTQQYCKKHMSQYQENQGQMGAVLEKMSATLDKISDFLFQGEGEEAPMEDEATMEGEEEIESNNPESLAMSAPTKGQMQFASKLDKKLSQMMDFQREHAKTVNAEIAAIKGIRETSQFEDKLKSICQMSNDRVDYESHRVMLQQFADAKSKQGFLDYVENNAMQFGDNQSGAILSAVKRENLSTKNYMQQFADKNPRVKAIAKKAQQDWRDTTHQSNYLAAEKFKKRWPSEEKYVQFEANKATIQFG